MSPTEPGRSSVPTRALLISLGALAVPVFGALAVPDQLGEYGALLWLVALIPAFLFAYHRGWQGAATALAAGMATLSVTQAIASGIGLAVPDLLLGIVVAYITISLAVGWLAEIMHRDRHEVVEMAFTDGLTSLPNRRHAEVFLENEFEAARRGRKLAIVLFDLDHFKAYNDSLGHQAGDEALRAFAEVLTTSTRRMNLCARFGGEEFLAVLAGSDAVGATLFAERVLTSLRERGLGNGPLTCSAGVAAYDETMRTPDALIAAADAALYEAKRHGRDRVEAHPDPSAEALAAVRESERVPDTPRSLAPHEISGFGRGRRILLVEDEAPVRGVIADYLRKEGFEVVEAETVLEGVEALANEFDVVLTDLRLPGASGHELVSASKSRWPRTPVVVITGIFDASLAADALHAGADRYLFKPFGMPDLRVHLTATLARRDQALAESESMAAMEEEARERADTARGDVLRGALSLVRAVEVRDPYTRGHSARVAAMAARIAEAIDPEERVLPRSRLVLGCQLHDVGKIGIPDAVLNKTTPLDEEEVEVVRSHPNVGRGILEPMLDDPVVLGIVTWHHEHWDGSGYPDGLAGDAIPLAARVVGVCDTLAAMAHPRAHRDAMDWSDAVAAVEDGRGARFDPLVLDACAELSDELRELAKGPPPSDQPASEHHA